MRKLLLALAAILVFQMSYGQDFSNKGKEFWLVFPAHTPSSAQAQMGLFITSDQNSSGTITVNGFSTTFTVTANQVTGPINIPYVNANVGTTNTVVNKGIHVVVNAGQPAVVVYAHIYAGFRSEASLILPVTTLGKKYISSNYYQLSTAGSMSQFNVVATEANTVVQYTLRVNGVLSTTPVVVNLPNPGDEIQVQNANDLSGTVIESIASGTGGCKRIAVFSGSSAILISRQGCTAANSYDPLFQQCYPVSSWGKNFGVVPLLNNPSGSHVRVFASEDNTTVNFNGTNITLNAGEYYPATSAAAVVNSTPTTPLVISADKPISVSQYLLSFGCTGSTPFPGQSNGQGDPDMVILNPVEQNISDINIFSSNLQNIRTKYLSVYMKTVGSGTFRINGAVPNAAFVAMPQGNGYSYLREDISNYVGSSFRLTSDSGFNAITYGMGDAESYAYSAGTNVKDLYQQISVQTQYGIENTPSVCSGSPFKFKISLPYKPTQLEWDFHNIPGLTVQQQTVTQYPTPGTCTSSCLTPAEAILDVCPDSCTTVNGKVIYWYSLPIQYNIPTVGVYSVNITAQTNSSEGCGSEQIISFDLTVSDPPVANFTFNAPGCVAETVQFNDATVTVKPNYHWYYNFGDGTPVSNLQNPSHTYATPGNYTVRFSSITTPGCLSDTLEKVVHVPANPSATIAVNTTAVCQNGTPPVVTITGAGGVPPYIFTYTATPGGTFNVTSDALGVATITVPTTAIGPFTYTLTNVKNSTPATTICTTSITGQAVTVNVNSLPTATISGATTICQNGTAPTITFTGASGTAPYNFTYTIDNGSGPGAPQTVVSNAAGVATVTAPSATAGTFTYALTGVSYGSPAACVNPVTGQSALVTVNALPTATISGNAELCLNATAPSVTFAGTGGTPPYIFSYTINSGSGPGPVLTATGNPAVVTAPTGTAGTYIYTLTGVSESSTTACSQAATGTATVKVNPQPTASFTATGPYCKDKTVTFTPAGSVSTGSITSWVWDYGDGTGSHTLTTNAPFTVTYTTIGTKTATLKTVSDKGCESTVATQTFTVSAGPQAGFIVPEVCLLDPFAQFTDTSKADAPNTITTWAWNFGDVNATPANPNTSSSQNPTHIYTAVGSYTVGLTVTTAAGCTDFIQHTLVISDGNPIANYTLSNTNTCAIDTTILTNKSTIASGNITKLEIYWDATGSPTVFTTDDNPVFNGTYRHGYPTITTDQNYTIRMKAYSGGVCFSTKDMPVTVHATPHVAFSAIPDVCLNNGTVQLTQGTETGGVPGTGVYSGTGVSSTGLFDPITAGEGTFTIKYKYTSTFGCVDSASQTIKVPEAPVAVFAAGTPSCAANAVTFTQNSTSAAGAIAQWIWNFGGADEVHTDGNPVTHTFTTAGTYPVTLTVVTAAGCKSTATSHNVLVNANPSLSFTIGTAPACLPAATITFTNTSPSATENTYTWYFQYPALTPASTSIASAQYTYTAAGPYTVRLAATNVTTGCTGYTEQQVTNIHLAPVASFDFSKVSICTDQSVNVIGTASTGGDGTIASYTWSYGDGTANVTGATPTAHTYTVPKTYDVTLTVENSFGCKDDSVRKFTVYPYPTVDAGETQYVLEGGSATLQPVVSGNGLQYLWSANTASTYLNSVTIKNPESHPLTDVTYTLLVTADGGCTASDNVMVKILKFPEIPNTFTPNNDGIHDFWDIQYLYTYPNNRVQVFSKSGQLVFESKGYSKPWDGNMNGKPLPIDTYYYIIEPGYGRKPITGYVTILK